MNINLTNGFLASLLVAVGLFATLQVPQTDNDDLNKVACIVMANNSLPVGFPAESSNSAEEDLPLVNLPSYILPVLPLFNTVDLAFWDASDRGIQLIFRLYRPPRNTAI